ncbi:Na(+)/citrate cotransporter-like [Haemaphysalis longicornis]
MVGASSVKGNTSSDLFATPPVPESRDAQPGTESENRSVSGKDSRDRSTLPPPSLLLSSCPEAPQREPKDGCSNLPSPVYASEVSAVALYQFVTMVGSGIRKTPTIASLTTSASGATGVAAFSMTEGTEGAEDDADLPPPPEGISNVVALRRVFHLLAQLDYFYLAADLLSGELPRVLRSLRVITAIALFLLVVWFSLVAHSADKTWRASSVGLLLAASLTMDLVAAPMASLLPLIFMPLLYLADVRETALAYSTVRQMSFLCAMLLVLTMEECGLSTRLALLILSRTGHQVTRILALVIAVAVAMTCLLDAFSVTVLMMSTVECIVDEIYFHMVQTDVCAAQCSPAGVTAAPMARPSASQSLQSRQSLQQQESPERLSYFAHRRSIFNKGAAYVLDERNTLLKVMMVAVVYGSNIGSGGTSRGSQQHYYLMHFLRQKYKEVTSLNYFTWTTYSAPSIVVSAVFLWWHLCRRWVPSTRFHSYETVALMMAVAYVNCSLVAQDWININDNTSVVRSETVMVGLTSLVFMVPARPVKGSFTSSIVSAGVIHSRMPWGVLLLVGAGCAMSLCFQVGEVNFLRLRLVSMAVDVHPSLGIALMVTLQGFLYEVESNHDSVVHLMAAITTLAEESQWNPLVLLLPITKVASLVFLLPVSSYGNALLFDYARMSCWEMITIGFPVKIVTILLELLSLLTVGYTMFDLGNFPRWATNLALNDNTTDSP